MLVILRRYDTDPLLAYFASFLGKYWDVKYSGLLNLIKSNLSKILVCRSDDSDIEVDDVADEGANATSKSKAKKVPDTKLRKQS